MGGLVFLLVIVAFYVYIALCLRAMARKTGTPDDWMAWIPIVNIYLLCKIAGKPGWWLILLLIPFVNIIFGIIVWMAAAKACGKPSWVGILIIVPFVNFVIPGYIAFAE